MNSTTSPLRAAAFLGISLLTQSLLAAPPPPLTAGEIAAIQDAAASKAPAAAAANAAAHASLDRDIAAAATATKAAAAFLVQTDLPPAAASAEPAAARPLDITPAATATVINCEGGMYFDADEGVLVYLKNVTVKDPRFDLSGANELKIFFEKKPANGGIPAMAMVPITNVQNVMGKAFRRPPMFRISCSSLMA